MIVVFGSINVDLVVRVMTSHANERKADLIDEVVGQLRERLPDGSAPMVERFVSRYYTPGGGARIPLVPLHMTVPPATAR